MADTNEDEYEIPLRDQRYFGAGIKRKRIQFVPSASENPRSTSLRSNTSTSAADRYLSIVLKKGAAPSEPVPQSTGSSPGAQDRSENTPDSQHVPAADERDLDGEDECTTPPNGHEHDPAICEICDRPIYTSAPHAHESSIAHQVRLQHSYPPSHLDRSRKGLAVMQTQGWDPDARLGLGAKGRGVLYPIKATANPERRGLGAEFAKAVVVEREPKMDAGKVRRLEVTGKKKAQSLRNAFYRSEEVERYLGEQEDSGGGSLDLEAFRRSKEGR